MEGPLILYVHGRGGSPGEIGHYRPLFPGCALFGVDYRSSFPRDAAEEIRRAAAERRDAPGGMVLIANSIGAYFSMRAGIGPMLRRAFFISPILDMEKLILGMMDTAGVTEEELRARGTIPTGFGEELSWDYLLDVRAHPVSWEVPTEILYGSRDALTGAETVTAFARAHRAGLTVMEGGEHWFHTDEQMAFLDAWLRDRSGELRTGAAG